MDKSGLKKNMSIIENHLNQNNIILSDSGIELFETLDLSYCQLLESVDGIANLPNLTSLDLKECQSLESVDGLANLPNLTTLDLSQCNIKNIDGLAKLTSLTELHLDYCTALKNIDGLANLMNLKELTIAGGCPLDDLNALVNLPNLTILFLEGMESFYFDLEGHDLDMYDRQTVSDFQEFIKIL